MKRRMISAFLAILMVFSLLPVASANGTQSATLTVEQVYANPGKDVTVKINIEDNPGILGATLTLSWEDGLELVDVENGAALSALTMTPPSRYISGCNFVWFGSETGEIIDGAVLILTFRVPETAADGDNYAINVTYESGDVLDGDYNAVEFLVENGGVQVITYLPGDVTGDKKINALDLVRLSQYISDGCKTDANGYNVSINESAADVNDDGKINALDLVFISRYISDGCKTDPTGYNITLKPSTPKCNHTMQEVSYQAATCTEDGNIGYWYCTTCEKCFTAADGKTELSRSKTVLPATGHTPVTDPAVAPTTTSEGKTEGSHCSTCGAILVAQTTIPATQVKTHEVSYDIANGDPYLEKLLANDQISNANPQFYEEGSGLTLKNLSVAGYRFLGWYDLPQNGTLVKKIDATATEDYELYAVWSKIEYTVQYKSSLFIERSSDTYTVDTGLVLPTPKLSNYIFTGWSDEKGKLYSGTTVPVGTTGNLILEANWTSERNKTWTKTELDAPIVEIDEETNTILFVYEIGMIENVPLYTIKDFGYISGDGVTKTATETYSMTVSQTAMEAYTKAVSQATTQSSNWTLSEDWNEITSINEEWCTENGYTKEEAETVAKSDTETWNISSGSSGSKETTTLETNEGNWQRDVQLNGDVSTTQSATESASLNASLGWSAGNTAGAYGGIGASDTVTTESSLSYSMGYENGGEWGESQLNTESTVENSGWNSSKSHSSSSTSSSSSTIASTISEKICETYGYGASYASGGSSSNSQGLTASQSASDEYASSVTYSTASSTEVTNTWTTQATKPGYHRWVIAGTAHVFAVVGYDMETNSYFVYTYSVIDDKTHEFEDYSYTTANYNDEQNGVISFEVPYEVVEYVAEFTCASEGLKVDQSTGTITGYSGTDNCVVIPEYMNVGNEKVVKITGISANAFRGNTNISAVILSDYIEEIPDEAFSGCSSLFAVRGRSITKIGANAFAGCTAVELCKVSDTIISLGENAFEDVGRVVVNAANIDVLQASVSCGAKKVELSVSTLENCPDCLSNKTLNIPKTTEYFEFNGNNKTYRDLTIRSDAYETVIKEATFVSTGATPLKISSSEASFNDVSIHAVGIALVLSAKVTDLGLQGTITVESENANALLCKDLNLYELNASVDGKLVVKDKILVCGAVSGTHLLSYNTYETIDSDTFENLQNSYTLTFNAYGGTCNETTRVVANCTPIGELPVPTRDYYTFVGWYLADRTTEVTAETVFYTGVDQTVYAVWTLNPTSGWVPVSDLPEGAEVIERKWTYDQTSYTSSSSSSLSGWTLYNTTSEWSSYGDWSSWSTSPVYASDSRKVDTKEELTGYNMIVYNTMSTGGSRQFRSFSIAGKYSSYGCASSYGEYVFSRTVSVSELNAAATVAAGKYTSNCTYPGYNKDSQTGYILDYDSQKYVFFISSNIYTTYYRYADRTLLYTYYYYKVDSLESSTYPSGDNISNVEELVRYRAK